MSIIQVNTSFNINLQFDIAPFHIRSFAWIIDFVILYIFHQAVSLLYSEFFGAGEDVGGVAGDKQQECGKVHEVGGPIEPCGEIAVKIGKCFSKILALMQNCFPAQTCLK